jgi:hypothetical protein
MRKPTVYNPLAMSSLEYANSYGKACRRFDKSQQKKQIEINRKNENSNTV